jgi:hypothetical protein
MIHRPTVLILGAGASAPYGFPTGRELVEQILRLCESPSSPFGQMMRAVGVEHMLVARFAKALSATQFDSIDAFLEHQPDFRDVGKLAIAFALLPCENEQKLLRPDVPRQHWYRVLFNELVTGAGLDASKLTVITLNYDRSLEHYLFITLQREFQLDEREAARRLYRGNFIHFHGELGFLPINPLAATQPKSVIDYGASLTPEVLRRAAKHVRIVCDFDPSDLFMENVREKLRNAEMVGFIGFAYHDPVMDRLGIYDLTFSVDAGPRRCFGSTFRLGRGKQQELLGMINRIELGSSEDDACAFVTNCELLFQGRRRLQRQREEQHSEMVREMNALRTT